MNRPTIENTVRFREISCINELYIEPHRHSLPTKEMAGAKRLPFPWGIEVETQNMNFKASWSCLALCVPVIQPSEPLPESNDPFAGPPLKVQMAPLKALKASNRS